MIGAAPFAAFDEWRTTARACLSTHIPPAHAAWMPDGTWQNQLLSLPPPTIENANRILIPKAFLKLARTVSCHSDPNRWSALYEGLWRLAKGEKHFMDLAADPLMRRLQIMHKGVRRDAHKAKAFVRFRLMQENGAEHYIAWHRPDHDILPLVAPFFQRRFSVMRWTIMTPRRSVHWNGDTLIFGEGVPESENPATTDAMEDLWRAYYRGIFNPARIKLKMMRREMPVRYWSTMPETSLIPELIAEAPARVAAMLQHQEGLAIDAAHFMPKDRTDLAMMRQAAAHCEACPLHRTTGCTVFGEGPEDAQLMIIGEQPGDEEDKNGRPFIGPAGDMLNQALADAGIDRMDIYVTNAVKHFKFEQKGAHRLHKTPGIREINACRPWLSAEIDLIKPKTMLSLGITAGRSLLGPGFSLKSTEGLWHEYGSARLRASIHPATILRAPNEAQRYKLYTRLVADLTACATSVYA